MPQADGSEDGATGTPRNETGQFQHKVSDDTIVEALSENGPSTSGDLADTVGSDRTARRRLSELESKGEVDAEFYGPTKVYTARDEE